MLYNQKEKETCQQHLYTHHTLQHMVYNVNVNQFVIPAPAASRSYRWHAAILSHVLLVCQPCTRRIIMQHIHHYKKYYTTCTQILILYIFWVYTLHLGNVSLGCFIAHERAKGHAFFVLSDLLLSCYQLVHDFITDMFVYLYISI